MKLRIEKTRMSTLQVLRWPVFVRSITDDRRTIAPVTSPKAPISPTKPETRPGRADAGRFGGVFMLL